MVLCGNRVFVHSQVGTGYHSQFDSIRKGEFVDLKDLLPEYASEAFISAGDKDKEKKKKVSIETFQDWALAYTTWASTIIAASPSRGLELLQYLGVIGCLARDNPPRLAAL